MAKLTRGNLNSRIALDWIAPGGALAAAVAVVGTALLLPAATLEDLVWQSGVASLLASAQPPLGVTARAVLALAGGGIAAAVVWSALFLLFGPGGFLVGAATVPQQGVPVLRKADAHPDHPARKPLSARDLGAPIPPVAVPEDAPPADPLPAGEPIIPPYFASIERDLPRDLDEPLAAFDPAAMPAVPRTPVPPVAPLRLPIALARGERIETVQLPMPRDGAEPPSIESLLRRLGQGSRPHRAAAG